MKYLQFENVWLDAILATADPRIHSQLFSAVIYYAFLRKRPERAIEQKLRGFELAREDEDGNIVETKLDILAEIDKQREAQVAEEIKAL